MNQCDSVLRALGQPRRMKVKTSGTWTIYKSELIDLRNQYQAVASEVSNFMVWEGKWDTCIDVPQGIQMPTHLIN